MNEQIFTKVAEDTPVEEKVAEEEEEVEEEHDEHVE